MAELAGPATLHETILTSPKGHAVYRTCFKDTPEFTARQHWLAARRKLITATDWASILGFTDKPSAYSVYVDKTTPITREELDADLAATNEQVFWGMELEDIIAKRAAKVLGRTFLDHGRYTIHWTKEVIPGVPIGTSLDREITTTIKNPARDVVCRDATCSLQHTSAGYHRFKDEPEDFKDPRGPGVYEGKTTGLWTHGAEWEITEDDEIGAPLRAQVQVQASMHVLGWSWGVIGCLMGARGFALTLREIEADSGFQDFIRWATPKLQDFWKRVEQRDPPPADGSESTYEALKRQHPRDSGFEIALPFNSDVWHAELTSAKAREKAAKADVLKYGNLIRAAMGEATFGVLPDGSRYSMARTKDPKPTCCPKCETPVVERKGSRPLRHHPMEK